MDAPADWDAADDTTGSVAAVGMDVVGAVAEGWLTDGASFIEVLSYNTLDLR